MKTLLVILLSIFIDYNGYYNKITCLSHLNYNVDILPYTADVILYSYVNLDRYINYIKYNEQYIYDHIFFNIDYKNKLNEIKIFKEKLLYHFDIVYNYIIDNIKTNISAYQKIDKINI